MSEVSVDDLRTMHACFVNIGCIQPFCVHRELLSKTWSGEHDRAVFYGPAMRPLGLADATDLLARSIVYDAIAIDSHAASVDRRVSQSDLDALPGLTMCRVGNETYEAAESAATLLRSSFRTGGPSNSIDSTFALGIDDKHVHEQIRGYGLANSGDNFARTVFYLEVARQAHTPVMFSQGKREMFRHLVALMESAVHERLADVVDAALLGSPKNAVSGDAIRVSVPALHEMLVLHARKHGCSLVEACRTIRGSDLAVEYRKWLADLQKLWMTGDPADAFALGTAMDEIERIAGAWGEQGRTNHGRRFTRRVVTLEGIPVVGQMLQSVSREKVQVPDVILKGPPKHVQFIASWYS